MSVLALKMSSALLIFIMAMIGGLLPVWLHNKQKFFRTFIYGEHFAHGIFLSACLLHLLPEALHHFEELYPHQHYPTVLLICLISVYIIQFIEQGALRFVDKNMNRFSPLLAYILMVLLSIHALAEGAALGFGEDKAHVSILLLAIISHKGAAAFALAIKMQHAGLSKRQMLLTLSLFSIMTPLGIICASWLISLLEVQAGKFFEAIFGAIAAGTFLAIALSAHGVHPPKEPGMCISTTGKFTAFGIAILLMAIAGIWV